MRENKRENNGCFLSLLRALSERDGGIIDGTLNVASLTSKANQVATFSGSRMLKVTESASDFLIDMLDKNPVGETVRIVFGLQGMEPQPSAVLPGDTTYEFNGRIVLVLDKTMSLMLAGKTLDVDESGRKPILRLS
ncbi:MAG: hypothetical protein A2289_06620 [Deltaproteobacteria bacterium RIFOXYA12_FULL_58_15]|nr:MAG: hypothetical protein A2289_06620 [Deltaproteobacteria bacterium RIFOXYA12_FULL_58_15]OGR10803.1 MAG: hypothetical protein A2341_24825 [Deltaproteobacteria bacterium RIFOXYB12_FULL_58_9]